MSGAAEGARPRVVLVDDSREVRAVVRRTLESSGLFEVVAEGGDGAAAFSLVDRFEPAILLLDASMPRLDGIEALPGVLALRPQTRVVVFTGFDEPALAARARELGAADVIGKWTPLDELPFRLMHTLERPMGGSPPGSPRLTVVGGGRAGGGAGGRGPGGARAGAGASRSGPVPEQGVLDEHVQQFRELFDRAAIGMATLTGTGTVVRANRALARLMSSSPEDLVGVDYGRLTERAGERLDHALDAILGSGHDLATFEHQVPAGPAGEPFGTVRVTLAPVRDYAGQVLYLFAQVQDITALRAAEVDLRRTEQVFRLLVAAVGEYAIFMLDVEGTVISWNAGARRIKGYAADEILGQHFRVFYPPWERARAHPERNLEVALRDGSFAEQGWRVRKDGTQFWASVVITPVYDDAGDHVGFAKVTRDQTTDREHAQAHNDFLAQQGQIMAVTAHELRTPAAVIDGSVGALLTSWDQMRVAERDALLAGIRSSASRLRRLASDLTTASGLHAETLQLRLEDVSLAELLRAAVARTLAIRPDAQVRCDVGDEVVVHADPVRLGQALDNLLDNAVRHGGAPVTLTGTAGRDTIRIRLTDAGPGVDAQLLPRLFQRFAVSGPSGATGLGLYLVREIARRHGGEAQYHPPAGTRPTTFEISLPRRGDTSG